MEIKEILGVIGEKIPEWVDLGVNKLTEYGLNVGPAKILTLLLLAFLFYLALSFTKKITKIVLIILLGLSIVSVVFSIF